MVWYDPRTWIPKKEEKPAPAPAPSQSQSSSSSSPFSTPSNPFSGGGSSSSGGTYNPSTGVYIDSSGQGFSTATPPSGATIVGGSSSKGGGSSLGSGGGTYNPSTGVYIDSSGQGFSTATPPSGAKITGASTSATQVSNLNVPKQTDWDRLGGTTTKVPETPKFQIMTTPYIEQRQEGTLRDIDTGYKSIPIFSYYYVDPTGIGKQTERKATTEEIDFFTFSTGGKDLIASDKKLPFYKPTLDKSIGLYETIQKSARESLEGSTEFLTPATEFIVDKTFLLPKGGKEFVKGAVIETFRDIEEQPLKNLAIFGVSAGAGFLVGGATKAVSLIPKVGPQLSVGAKFLGVGAGAYFIGKETISTATRISLAETPYEKGAVLGVSAKDLGITLTGFKVGYKGFQVAEGMWRTRGREFIDIPQGEYPSASAKTHLKMFQENVIKELGERPGAFHTTGDSSFYKSGEFKPIPGTSELSGTYGSTQISTPFSRIPGSSSNTEITLIQKMTTWWKGMKTPVGEPGVAFLQPEGFRGADIKFSKTPTFEGQAFIKRGGEKFYAYFTQPAKAGFADVPGIKTEIEAIFRPGAGGYSFVSGTKYTKINGVRVPIDSFVYDPKISVPGVPSTKVLLVGGTQSSYSLPSSTGFSGAFSLPGSSSSSSSDIFRVSLLNKISKSSETSINSIPSIESSVSSDISSIGGSKTTRSSRRSKSSKTSISSLGSIDSSLSNDLSSIGGGSSGGSSKGPSSSLPKSLGGSSTISSKIDKPFAPSYFDFIRPFKEIPKIKFLGGKTTKGRYAPSIAGIGLGIKAPKIPTLYKAGAGGLIIRPMILTKSRRETNGKRKRSSTGTRKSSSRRKRN